MAKTFRKNLAWKSDRGGDCFLQRLKKAEYRLKIEQLIKANSKLKYIQNCPVNH